MNYKFSLDRSSKKFLCPACEKRRFVRYVDNETGDYINENVGLCDRANNCNYHLAPKAYFESKGGNISDYKIPSYTVKPKVKKKTRFCNRISKAEANTTLVSELYEQNDFIIYLDAAFGVDLANKLIQRFWIGTYKKWGRAATVFPQVDENGEIRTAKIMAFNSETGNRIKGKDRPLITWFHSELKRLKKIEGYQLEQCLFGEHQLAIEPKDKPIAIVESEKTAIIMTILWPQFIWMACGGLTQIKKEIFLPLLGRKIMLFPDLNAFDKWEEKMEVLVESGFDVSISSFLEESACEEDRKEGYDLADFFLKRDIFFWLGFDRKKISGFLGLVN